jgi:hypothetical protein
VICRYEDLVDDASGTLDDILSFLGETPVEGMIERSLASVDTLGLSDPKSYRANSIHSESLMRWQSLPQAQISRLAPLINPMLERCGYDTVEGDGSSDLDAARRRYATSLAILARQRGHDA